MNKKRVGFLFVFLAFMVALFNVNITGAAIGTLISGSFSMVAIIFLLVGLTLLLQREKNYAQEVLERRHYVDDTGELKRIARKMGYTLVEGYKEGTRVYDENHHVLTVIPHHHRIHGRGTIKSILESLATGESSFRQMQH